jgi:hypothetical protein
VTLLLFGVRPQLVARAGRRTRQMMDDWGRSRQVMGLAQPNLRWATIMLGLCA